MTKFRAKKKKNFCPLYTIDIGASAILMINISHQTSSKDSIPYSSSVNYLWNIEWNALRLIAQTDSLQSILSFVQVRLCGLNLKIHLKLPFAVATHQCPERCERKRKMNSTRRKVLTGQNEKKIIPELVLSPELIRCMTLESHLIFLSLSLLIYKMNMWPSFCLLRTETVYPTLSLDTKNPNHTLPVTWICYSIVFISITLLFQDYPAQVNGLFFLL